MRVKVRLFGDLMALLGDELIIEFEDEVRVKDLFMKLMERTGSSRKNFLGHYNIVKDLEVLLNGRNIKALNGFETQLKEGDTLVLFPPLVGG